MRDSFKKLWMERVLSALDLAILSGRVDLLKVLLERISISNVRSFVFYFAMHSSNPKVFQFLRKSQKCQKAWNVFYRTLVWGEDVSNYVQLMILRGCAVNLPLLVRRDNANKKFIRLKSIRESLKDTYGGLEIDMPEELTFTQVAILLYDSQPNSDGVDSDVDLDTGKLTSIALLDAVFVFPVNLRYAQTCSFFLKRGYGWWKKKDIDGKRIWCPKDCLFLRCVDKGLLSGAMGFYGGSPPLAEGVFGTVLLDQLQWEHRDTGLDALAIFNLFCHTLLKSDLSDIWMDFQRT